MSIGIDLIAKVAEARSGLRGLKEISVLLEDFYEPGCRVIPRLEGTERTDMRCAAHPDPCCRGTTWVEGTERSRLARCRLLQDVAEYRPSLRGLKEKSGAAL